MKLLTNPIFLKMVLVFFASGFAFVTAILLMRRLRRSLSEQDEIPATASSAAQLPMHAYHAVIQELKQQKHELAVNREEEQRRAKTSENISATIIANLSCGVLFFGSNGLVRQANHAAKEILGIASLTGMDADSIFRQTSLTEPGSSSLTTLPAHLDSVLRNGTLMPALEAEHRTPAGQQRLLEVVASRVVATDGKVLGVACLINDKTNVAEILHQIELRHDLAAEMALELRTSLVTISGYAQQLAQNRDPELAAQLAADIAAEAKHLEDKVGGFLAEGKKARAAHVNS